jgi:hypothetical protein
MKTYGLPQLYIDYINTPQHTKLVENVKRLSVNPNKLISEHRVRKEKIETITTLNQDVHAAIIKKFNLAIREKILKGYYYNFGKLGGICMGRFERTHTKTAVDWKKSNDYKKQLIAEGKEPAKKISKDEDGNLIMTNDNYWLFFRTDEYYVALTTKKYYYPPKEKGGKVNYYNCLVKNNYYWKYTVLRLFTARMNELLNNGIINPNFVRTYKKKPKVNGN